MKALQALAGWKGYVLAVCIGMWMAWWAQSLRLDAQVATLRAGYAAEIEAQATAALNAVQAARDEEWRRINELEATAIAAHEASRLASLDAAARAASEQRLRQRIGKVLANAVARDPTLAAGSAPGRTDLDLLADVLGRSIERSGQLAVAADRARIAGLTCERAYDSLRRTMFDK